MWVVNREKENAKFYLTTNIGCSITNILANSNDIQKLVANINYTIGGVPSCTDTRWIGGCQRAMSNLSRATGLLQQALEHSRELNVKEWVDDGE